MANLKYLLYFYLFLLCYECETQMLLTRKRLRKLTKPSGLKLKERLHDKLNQYRQRNTQTICYDIVGCFELPHSRSPLQKMPENPEILNTTFYLFKRDIDFNQPQTIIIDDIDDSRSLNRSKFNPKLPLKAIIHGYMGKWDNIGIILSTQTYLKLYDCNVLSIDWSTGAKGPHYAQAAANTEVIGRQLGLLLLMMIQKGLRPDDIHLIGFSLGAHIAGIASEVLKKDGYLIGRISGLDAASPLFRTNHLREKHKKLDKDDARLVDVIHTDASPTITDGFGLWQPLGHVDYFPNGGQEQPGCRDRRQSVVVSHFEKSLTRDIACSHLRAWHLFLESLLNKASNQTDSCDFISFSCPGGLKSFEDGHCFPTLIQSNQSRYNFYIENDQYEIGKFGEDVKGNGVMFFVTKKSSPFCGTQLQGSIYISQRTGAIAGEFKITLNYKEHSVDFNIICKISDFVMTGTVMSQLFVVDHRSLDDVREIDATIRFNDAEIETNQTYPTLVFIDKLMIRDMHSNSTIHLCERKHNQEKIVIKLIHIGKNSELLETAKNEVAVLKTLNHPNIIKYYDNFLSKGTYHIVMEYANQGTLFDYIAKNRPNRFHAQIVMNFFCQILSGLNHIHEKNVIHRDLKCENIFLTGIYGNVIKIGDFGISKLLMSNTSTDTIVGTCNYAAPEVCNGKPYNYKSDIWSLGCVLYELCMMEKMFDGPVSNVIMSIVNGRIKKVDTDTYGTQIQQLIEIMLDVDPDKRPDTNKMMCFGDIFPSLFALGTNLGCIFDDKQDN